ncbi:ribosomal protein L21, putative [Eimeria acervulina]|uniref:Ribosomal protein L21, putative n=1 Tax=Eimeria acervulina TaxID=5801 RepID=U6GKY2_EIMAC|nr:ribosomal protein L21, putative [Eimeria acervulina]CDI79254.1 ribosomal protein L21, putative [Eimeria acervulina]
MEVGRFYDVNRIKQKEGGKLMLLRVLLLQQKDGPTLMGQPFLENIRVWARVLKHFRGPKLHLGKHRPKKWRKMWGHRQALSRILIERIEDVQQTMQLQQAQQDPLVAALLAIRRYEQPSKDLPLYRAAGLSPAVYRELPLVGDDPLALLDPHLNSLVAARLAKGYTDILPILGEGVRSPTEATNT